jgi:hypothetical protein
MNRLAARIVPTLDDAGLDAVVTDHYRAEAQTLASGAEAALLKLAELRGRADAAEVIAAVAAEVRR